MVKLHWIPLFPLLGFLVNGLWSLIAAQYGREAKKIPVAFVANIAAFSSFFMALYAHLHLMALPEGERLITQDLYAWIGVGDLHVRFALQLDPLSSLMALVVTGVGSLIHLYSVGYMHKDPGLGRYFSYLNLFLAAMLVLVLANNLPLLFMGWEGVGLCSYLLIGFWFEDVEKAKAGKKAFVVNRIGDFGFLLGIFLCFTTLGTVEFSGMAEKASLFHPGAAPIPHAIGWICFLLFLGACGKSAQLPLHVWLPDAMAGPTPVSALIHAATMVTAGVYMIARLSFLFALVPDVGFFISLVGSLTALMAALIAMTQNDIKKVLAYSTVSQLGYMFLAVGSGAYVAGIFHLMTHAFFKGLLFLGAGSVIHAMSEEQDIRKMGGLMKRIPYTAWTFLIATVAIIGIPPFSGFFSKDEILWSALKSEYRIFWVLGAVTAFLTAFYMVRLFVLTFLGRLRADEKTAAHIHESPWVMVVPLVVLAILAAASGFLGIPHFLHFLGPNILEHFLEPVFSQAYLVQESFLHVKRESVAAMAPPLGEGLASLCAIAIAFTGAGLGYWTYLHVAPERTALSWMKSIQNILLHKFYIDEIYEVMVIRPIQYFSERILWKEMDVRLIDGFILALGRVVSKSSVGLRKTQSGTLRYYVLSLLAGVFFLVGYVLLKG